jgi:hypothetical protein
LDSVAALDSAAGLDSVAADSAGLDSALDAVDDEPPHAAMLVIIAAVKPIASHLFFMFFSLLRN